MIGTENLVKVIVEGLQEKKAQNVVTIDMRGIEGAISEYMVVAEGRTPTQVSALSDSVWDFVRRIAEEKPISMHGEKLSEWVGIDYGNVLVHIFLPELRTYYNLEHLWADSKIEEIPNID